MREMKIIESYPRQNSPAYSKPFAPEARISNQPYYENKNNTLQVRAEPILT